MKMKTLSMLAGVGAPLIATASAPAGFLGITVSGKENAFGLIVCNVYANFDRPPTKDPKNPGGFIFHDLMQAVAGTVNAPMLIQVEGGGSFYNHGFGSDTAPSVFAIGAFPSVAFDTFVTIGAKQSDPDAEPPLTDVTTITPGFPGLNGTQISTNESGWAVTPIDPQGDPYNTDYGGPGGGTILIGQFSTLDGSGISGNFLVQYVSNGEVGQSVVSFFHVPTPGALALLGTAGLIGARRRRRS